MPGLKLIARSRPVYNPATAKLTFTLPVDAAGAQLAKKGDLLAMLILSDIAEPAFVEPATWTVVDTIGATEASLAVRARSVQDNEPTSIVVSVTGATKERQGQLLLLRGSTPAFLREASASAAFAATLAPASALTSSQQAINLALAIWSSSGAPVLTAPAGYTVIDSYASALTIAPRACLLSYRIVGLTGNFTPPAAAASVLATGRAFVEVLRDRTPHQPTELYDPVPGNIGLIG